MENLTGRLDITALGETEHDTGKLVAEINRVIKPAQRATTESVHIGVLMAASNQVNTQGGCFAREELAQLAEFIIDAPVLIGHKKNELPIGRVFKGEIVDRAGVPWLRALFYWHRNQSNAREIKTGIDSGIYKECSLGFLYAKPECGVCRGDMRQCRHRVNEVVRLGGREIKAFYYYKQIERVLEISLVYRGAVAGTSVSTLSVTNNQNSHSDCGHYELRRENSSSALLTITLDGVTTRLRLFNFGCNSSQPGRRLLCEDASVVHSRDLHLILERGKLRCVGEPDGQLEFFGTLLRGRYQLERKEGGI